MSKSYKRQKQAKNELDIIWEHPENVCVIHYSCESFYDRPDGSSPRITSIAVRNLRTAQTQSFSIHKFGELAGIPANDLHSHYNQLEKTMLCKFYSYVSGKRDYKWVHWNMRDENFGFHAIELRAKILGLKENQVCIINDEKKYDLARILVGIYGHKYADNPKMQSLVDLNNIKILNFKSGEEEAKLFQDHNYVALHQSTLSKVDLISNICSQAYERKLKTKSSFWEKNGGSVAGIIGWLYEHPIIMFLSILANLGFGINLIMGLIDGK